MFYLVTVISSYIKKVSSDIILVFLRVALEDDDLVSTGRHGAIRESLYWNLPISKENSVKAF